MFKDVQGCSQPLALFQVAKDIQGALTFLHVSRASYELRAVAHGSYAFLALLALLVKNHTTRIYSSYLHSFGLIGVP